MNLFSDEYLMHHGIEDDYLIHHGIKGQKWGVRRYQNPDGSLTKAGLKRQARDAKKAAKKEQKLKRKADIEAGKRLEKTRGYMRDGFGETYRLLLVDGKTGKTYESYADKNGKLYTLSEMEKLKALEHDRIRKWGTAAIAGSAGILGAPIAYDVYRSIRGPRI